MRRGIPASVLPILLVGCGGSPSPSLPSPAPQPTVTVFLDGITGARIGAGQMADARQGIPGYLPRIQPFADTIFLWPAPGESGPEIGQLVYGDTGGSSGVLIRWREGEAPIFWCADPVLNRGEIHLAMGEIGLASGLRFAEGPPCVVEWASGPPLTSYRLSGAWIVGARVTVPVGTSMATIAHEAGHVLGLRHSPHRADLMWPYDDRRRLATFSPWERDQLTMMYRHRLAGNRYPDTAGGS